MSLHADFFDLSASQSSSAKWSRRRSVAFVVAASAAIWIAVILMGYYLIS